MVAIFLYPVTLKADTGIPGTAAIASLQSKLSAIVGKLPSNAKAGIVIADLSSGDVLFETSADTPMKPASNMKIITTAAALSKRGPEFTFQTSVLSSVPAKNGTLPGNLYFQGGGDPFLVQEQLWKITDSLRSHGLRHVKGNIVIDAGFFDDVPFPDKNWKRINNRYSYNAPTSGVAFNFNSVGVEVKPGDKIGDHAMVALQPDSKYFTVTNNTRTGRSGSRISLVLDLKETEGACIIDLKGSIPINCKPQLYWRHVKQPALYCGITFLDYLTQCGIRLDGRVVEGTVPEDAQILTTHTSRPLSTLLRDANKYSNNFMMEQILKTIGTGADSKPGSTEEGIRQVTEFLWETGMDIEGFVMQDGSGLSSGNRITARQACHLIRYIVNTSTYSPEFLNCLPIAGVDGTLKKRLKADPRHRMVRAKTGIINGATCLSGIVDGRGGQGLVFSLLFNTTHNRHRELKKCQDKILIQLLDYWLPDDPR
jgi:serine-type D-Ala-D-Ala carboxypeptidase/endopeptidase (penicillin-binding protein 4)